MGKAAAVAPEIFKKVTPIAFEGAARVVSLLPGLLLAPVNGNADPAKDRDWQLYHRNYQPQATISPPPPPDELRLAELERALATQTLTPQEEAELIILLAKVKGIHINSLADIADPNAIALPMRKGHVPLRNFTYLHDFAYTKRNPADRIKLRQDFGKKNGARETFLKDLAMDSTKMARIKRLGMSAENLDRIKAGLVPIGYRVHHKLSLDDGGDNSFTNLVIIKDDPYHLSVTVLQNTSMGNLAPGETQIIDWPTINDYIYPNY